MRTLTLCGLLSLGLLPADSRADERLERPNAAPVVGRVVGDAKAGFRFEPKDGSAPFDLTRGASVAFEPDAPPKIMSTPPFHVVLGRDQRVSGRLVSVDAATIRLEDGPDGRPVAVDRRGALAILQRSGEALVLEDGFEKLDSGVWISSGSPEISDRDKLSGERSLALPAGGSSIVTRLQDPVGQGRVEVAFYDDGKTVPREQTVVELSFRGEFGPEVIRAVLGWNEETLALESPGGPALAVQRLARKAGWRRLGIRFSPERTEVAVDGDDLAHGKGPRGPMVEVRLGTRTVSTESGATPKGLAARFDDLRVVRFSTPNGEMEVDPARDEVRLANGDQAFGALSEAKPDGLALIVNGTPYAYPWREVAGVYLKREATPSKPITGLNVRVEWRSAPGGDPSDTDAVEGALLAANDAALTVETPRAGTLTIPRDRVRRLRVFGRSTRIVLDPFSHHLGDDVSEPPERLDPPQHEGGVLERSFEVAQVPAGPIRLLVDAVQVVGEAPAIRFAPKIKDGELRTNIWINGKLVDYLNRFITTNNETPETVAVPIPPEALKPGKNVIAFRQVGLKSAPEYFDDLGILGLTIEFDEPAARSAP